MRRSVLIPRFRFGLRSFFVLITLLCAGLAWCGKEALIVRERQQVRAWLASRHNLRLIVMTNGIAENIRKHRNDLTWARRLLGDQLLFDWHLIENATPEELSRCAAAFPEARFSKLYTSPQPAMDGYE